MARSTDFTAKTSPSVLLIAVLTAPKQPLPTQVPRTQEDDIEDKEEVLLMLCFSMCANFHISSLRDTKLFICVFPKFKDRKCEREIKLQLFFFVADMDNCPFDLQSFIFFY